MKLLLGNSRTWTFLALDNNTIPAFISSYFSNKDKLHNIVLLLMQAMVIWR